VSEPEDDITADLRRVPEGWYLDAGGEPVETCSDCGHWVTVGDWPFCATPANPDGHAKGSAYSFQMRMDMQTNGWSRSKR
jgi:hypothetical protein